jgi:hypothetical protein
MNLLCEQGRFTHSFPASAKVTPCCLKRYTAPTWLFSYHNRFEKGVNEGVLERAPP